MKFLGISVCIYHLLSYKITLPKITLSIFIANWKTLQLYRILSSNIIPQQKKPTKKQTNKKDLKIQEESMF